MARIDQDRHDLTMTIAIYGAPKSGKTSVLHCIRERVAADRHGDLAPLGSDSGAAALLDWLPLELGVISGWNARVHLYAIPDQRHADATRRVILADADGVLFAADSQAVRLSENLVAFTALRDNLLDAVGEPRDVPLVFLYTKQDLPPELLLSRTALDQQLNPDEAMSFAVSALKGDGVLEALHATISMAMRRLVRRVEKPS
jgi:signal recognition particle receptor subunit beta